MLVTVYTPTKNRLDALIRAIDSVLAQTYVNIELIVVNDGSTDGTAAYLEQRASQDQRLKYFNREVSQGAPAARNLAIKNASGTFITGLDDDDEFLPERIRAFVDYWNLLISVGLTPSCIYAQDVFTANGNVIRTTNKKGMVRAEDLFEGNFVGNQVFAPVEHFIGAGLFDERLPAWQDLEMFMRILKKYGTAHLLDYGSQLYDDSPKTDRISIKGEQKLRMAYSTIASTHAADSGRNNQQLYLQMFQKNYGIKPTLNDWINFLKLGFWPKGIVNLLIKTLSPG